MSEKTIAIKAQRVDEVADMFSNSVSAIVADVRGLTVAQADDLRSQLRNEGVSLKVIKNKILTRAAEKAGYQELSDLFKGPSAIAFSKEDVVAPARILKKFSGTADALELKGGVIDRKIADLDTINRYAALPSKETLLQQLLSEFQSPLRSFMYAVKAVAEKREADGETAETPAQETASDDSKSTKAEASDASTTENK
ncbi:50S ribosomal protein L10 [Oenococcus sp. UCMA 16435]|nr:50S ribosomal protein L10 [Oenococcus sp. UCMA 16435]MDI4583525.1 50S ribosomal protein L10 [Oenococcus sp. UCMA 14587]